ncbi:MAG: 3D domain-containing protein [Lachnospiraceae bacterium]|nr:3D domain-containing protein [Lachnospiraceae bacterium]
MRKYGVIAGTLSLTFAMVFGFTSFAEVNGRGATVPTSFTFEKVAEPAVTVELSENENYVLTNTASGITVSLKGKDKAIDTVKNKTLKAKKSSKKTSSKKTKVKSKKKKNKASKKQKSAKLKFMGNYKVTAYCPCAHCCGKNTGITASGTKATAGRTIAADTSVLPFGTKVNINGHTYTVEDRGGAIKSNKIDIYFDTHQEALNFGVQYLDVYVEE